MGLIFRTSSLANPGATSVKNSALTYAEGDGNFAWLATNLSGSSVQISGSTSVSGSVTVRGRLGINTTPSPSYTLDVSGSFRVSPGSNVIEGYSQFRGILNLDPTGSLPAGSEGDLVASGGALWFFDGNTWREVSLL